ncbi:MAG: TVP38/TMEM64 family protein [Pirellulaceae bacterium]|nr:TVP38/TMEM64 family protein [Pirellulaceae bacterium]
MPEQPTEIEKPSSSWLRWLIFGCVVSLAIILYVQFAEVLSLKNLAQQETQLRDFQSRHPWLVYAASLLIYVSITGLSLPGAAPLTMLFGWYFGVFQGVLLVSFASTTGATLAFLLSRFLFRNSVQNRFGDRLDSFNRALAREGPFYLFSLRLIPAVPFFVINAVMGLTPIRVWTFWWVSQLGMLAGTLVYVYAGSTVPDLATLADQGINAVFSARQLTQILVAFVLLGLFPLISRWIITRVTRKRVQATEIEDS